MALFEVSEAEITAIQHLPVPKHPGTVFDDASYIDLIARAFSVTAKEKREIVSNTPTFSQYQIDELFRILMEEREKFAELNARHEARLIELAEKRNRWWQAVEASYQPRKTVELAATEKSEMLRSAIPDLVAPLGGKAQAFMRAFLERIANDVASGGSLIREGTLAEIFTDELSNPQFVDAEGRKAPNIVNAKIHPMLSKVRTAQCESRQGRYVVTLVADGPEKSQGPVQAQHRITILIRPDRPAAPAAEMLRSTIMNSAIRAMYEAGFESSIRQDALGSFMGVVHEALQQRSYPSHTARLFAKVPALLSATEHCSRILDYPERISFLLNLFQLQLRGRHDMSGPAAAHFDVWFIDAAQQCGQETDAPHEREFKSLLSSYSQFSFEEKVFVLKAWFVASPESRNELAHLLSSAHLPDALTDETYVLTPQLFSLDEAVANCLGDTLKQFHRVVRLKTSVAIAQIETAAVTTPMLSGSGPTKALPE